jgi:hypothetical protein
MSDLVMLRAKARATEAEPDGGKRTEVVSA